MCQDVGFDHSPVTGAVKHPIDGIIHSVNCHYLFTQIEIIFVYGGERTIHGGRLIEYLAVDIPAHISAREHFPFHISGQSHISGNVIVELYIHIGAEVPNVYVGCRVVFPVGLICNLKWLFLVYKA
ncbi:hypothetical protein DSECCO2_627930 [anaerobic digester metagenome]